MNRGEIDLNLLRVMQAVDQEGSVTRGAQRLGLSQPAVSNALARLRRVLGDPLFVRSSRGMEATPRARKALDALDVALGLIRQGLRDASAFDPARAEEAFDLLISDLGELVYLPALMRHLEACAPRVKIKVRQLARSSYAEALEAGAADVAIGYLAAPRGSLRARRLFTDGFVCMVRAGHPALDEPFTLERYLALSHILVARRGSQDGPVSAVLAGLGVERSVALTIPHFAAAPQVIAASDLAVTVPSQLGHIYADAGITTLPLPFATPSVQISIYWHERLHADPANRWLRDTLVSLLAQDDTREG